MVSSGTACSLILWNKSTLLIGRHRRPICSTPKQLFATTSLVSHQPKPPAKIREQFPDADLSPCTYGDVYRIIYNVENADDIVSITAREVIMFGLDEEYVYYHDKMYLVDPDSFTS